MRVPAIVAATAIVLAACGGEKKAEDAGTTPPAAAGDAAAPAGGATHEVQMIQEGTSQVFKFVPADLTIKAGESVTFKSVSGQMHDVAFYTDSLTPAQAAFLKTAIPDQMQELATSMIPEGQSVTISFANAPPGVYKFYCLPHQPMGMKGTITVQ